MNTRSKYRSSYKTRLLSIKPYPSRKNPTKPCGMGVEDVDRAEAEALGLIRPGETPTPPERDLNDRLSASVRDLAPDIKEELRAIFGDQVRERDGRLEWVENRAAKATESANTVQKSLESAGITPDQDINLDQAKSLIEQLKEEKPIDLSQKAGIKRAPRKIAHLSRQALAKIVRDFGEFLPPSLASRLPDFTIQVKHSIRGACGTYDPNTKTLCLAKKHLMDPAFARRVIFHELCHWLHFHDPQATRKVKALWDKRTTSEKSTSLAGVSATGKKDKFLNALGDEYAGRIYPWEKEPQGIEVLSRHLEMLADPENLMKNWNFTHPSDGSHAWREAFLELLQIIHQ